MERLLVLKLDAVACEAEAWLNGIAIARVDAARPRAVVPIHEYTVAGVNRLELVVWPHPAAAAAAATPADPPAAPPLKLVADGHMAAHLRILLPRAGNPVDEASARGLAQLDWAPPAGEAFEAPLNKLLDLPLPVSFPRWRWLDAPLAEATPALAGQALALLQHLARVLDEGNTEAFVSAVRLRTEEIATAYQIAPEQAAEGLRQHLAELCSAGPPAWLPLEPGGVFLRRLAGGRLFECLDASGEPALRTAADARGQAHVFPLRLAAVEGKLYVLR